MASIRDIPEAQLFIGIIRGEEFKSSYEICNILKDTESKLGTILGTFSCQHDGLFMGAQVLDNGDVVKTIGPVQISSPETGYGDIFTNVGMIGTIAGKYLKETVDDAMSVKEVDLFGNKYGTEVNFALDSKIEEEKLVEKTEDGRPTEFLFGICDKMKWIKANDDNGDVLSINWTFGPEWVAVGCTVTNLKDNKVVLNYEPIKVLVSEGSSFYTSIGNMCNAISGNAVLWMLNQ